jgi:hypothetical protein
LTSPVLVVKESAAPPSTSVAATVVPGTCIGHLPPIMPMPIPGWCAGAAVVAAGCGSALLEVEHPAATPTTLTANHV